MPVASPSWFIFVLIALACGSIPFGLLIARARGVDIRSHGSKNIGATNVWRVLGPKAGLACFVLDVLKGLVPTLAAGWWHGVLATESAATTAGQAWWWAGVMVGAIFGHMFSPFVGFRGGKGVATGLGAMLGIWPMLTIPALAVFVLWIAVFKVSRYVSLASITAAAMLPAIVVAFNAWSGRLAPAWPFAVVTGVLAGVVIFKHRGNIARLRAGTELRVGAQRSA